MDFQELSAERLLTLPVATALILELKAETRCDTLDGFREVQAFAIHDELKGVAALLRAEAIPQPSLWVHFERRTFL